MPRKATQDAQKAPAPIAAPQELLTVKDLVRILKFERKHVYQIILRGDLPVIRIGSQIRVRPESLDKWIAEHEEVS